MQLHDPEARTEACAVCGALTEQLGATRDENDRLRLENARAIEELGKVYQELDAREESHGKLHRRAQAAEAALVDADKLRRGLMGRGLGRRLLAWHNARLEHDRAELMELVQTAILGFRDLGSGHGDIFAASYVLKADRALKRIRQNGGGNA
jgi:hypothetical protein